MIKKLTNANAYLNGQTLIGKIAEVDLPEVKHKMTELKALGMMGDVELPSGFEKMEAKIKWNAFFAKEWLQMGNMSNVVNLTIRGNQEGFNSLGRVEQEGVVIVINGIFKSLPLGKFKQNEVVDLETVMTVYAVTLIIDNVPQLVIDVMSNTFKVGVIDMLSVFDSNT